MNKLIKKIGTDKLLHFSFSYLITLTACLFLGWWGALLGLGVAIGKEAYDYATYGRKMEKAKFFKDSIGDMVANVIGIALALIVFVVQRGM